MALQQGISWFRRQSAPVTVGLIVTLTVFAFVWWFAAGKGMEKIALLPDWQSRPWSLITYPWAHLPFTDGFAVIGFVFLCFWIFFVGGSTERDLGPVKYLGLWLSLILLPGLFIGLIAPLVSRGFGAAGMWLPLAGMTVIWATRNPKQTIMLYGILPLSGMILGWITLASVMILAGFGSPFLGVICALHLPIAWAFAANKLPVLTYSRGSSFGGGRSKVKDNQFLKKNERMDASYFDDVKKREKDREERERLRKLFESSLNDDTGTDR